jgi:DNA adenine methylase
VDINYTVGDGQGGARRGGVIYSWERAAEPAGLF